MISNRFNADGAKYHFSVLSLETDILESTLPFHIQEYGIIITLSSGFRDMGVTHMSLYVILGILFWFFFLPHSTFLCYGYEKSNITIPFYVILGFFFFFFLWIRGNWTEVFAVFRLFLEIVSGKIF